MLKKNRPGGQGRCHFRERRWRPSAGADRAMPSAPRRGGRPLRLIMAMLGVLALVVLMLSASAPVSDGLANAGARHALITARQHATAADASGESKHTPVDAMEGAQPRPIGSSSSDGRDGGSDVLAASGVTAAPSSPMFEATVPVDPPAMLEPILASDSAVIAPPQCHARAHTEYDGIAVKCAAAGCPGLGLRMMGHYLLKSFGGRCVERHRRHFPPPPLQPIPIGPFATLRRRWGDKNVLPDASACCASCDQHARHVEAAGAKAAPPCNAWVFCADAEVSSPAHSLLLRMPCTPSATPPLTPTLAQACGFRVCQC
jgi:hypothetical protein